MVKKVAIAVVLLGLAVFDIGLFLVLKPAFTSPLFQ